MCGVSGDMEGGKEQGVAEVTILLSYLVVSLVASCAFLWVLLHRGNRAPHNESQQSLESIEHPQTEFCGSAQHLT